jgi:hypothetical protein
MRPRIRKILQPLSFLAPPATALLGLTIGMSLGAVLIVPAKRPTVVPPPARVQQAQAPQGQGQPMVRTGTTAPKSDFERRMVMQSGF